MAFFFLQHRGCRIDCLALLTWSSHGLYVRSGAHGHTASHRCACPGRYRGVAAEGSMLFFLIIQLCIIEHMYQFSLDSFVNFLMKAIDKTTPSEARIGSDRDSVAARQARELQRRKV